MWLKLDQHSGLHCHVFLLWQPAFKNSHGSKPHGLIMLGRHNVKGKARFLYIFLEMCINTIELFQSRHTL